MLISESRDMDVFIFTLKGRLDAVTASKLEDRFYFMFDNGEKKFLLDLSGIDYISSNGIRAFLIIERKIAASGGNIAFCSVQPRVFEVFKMTKLDGFFKFYDNQRTAVFALNCLK